MNIEKLEGYDWTDTPSGTVVVDAVKSRAREDALLEALKHARNIVSFHRDNYPGGDIEYYDNIIPQIESTR